MAFSKLVNSTSRIIAGDDKEERQLRLQPIPVSIPKAEISKLEFEVQQQQFSELAAAGKALGMGSLQM